MSSTQAVVIRDAIVDRINAGLRGVFKTVRKTPLPTLQPTDLPACSVFVLGEDEPSDGAPNLGHLKYLDDCTIGISVARAFDDPKLLEGALDDDVGTIKALLLTDASFTKRSADGYFESVPRIRRNWVFSNQAEGYLAELRLEMTFRFRETFLPVIPDALKEIDVTVVDPKTGRELAEQLIELPQT
jgi:hypothetical protein